MRVIHEGDEIIVPVNTYIASILAITENRLKSILIEPEINTVNIDSSLIEEKISVRTRGIMIVHHYGRNAMHHKIKRLVDKYQLKLIEDNAQSSGTHYFDNLSGTRDRELGIQRRTGSLGDAGAITTSNGELAEVMSTSQLWF